MQQDKSFHQKTTRQAHNNYVRDIIGPHLQDNSKQFNGYIESKKQESAGVAALRDQQGYLHSDSEATLHLLNMQFKSVYTKESLENIPNKSRSPYPNMPKIQVTEQGVHTLLKHIKPHKATGPDKIQGRFLKEMTLEITPAITYLFNKSLDLGRVSKDWLDAHIVPVFKKGDKNTPSNYRPVSLTCILCKSLEHIIESSIMKHLDTHKILTD
jgi:hypothetical protein